MLPIQAFIYKRPYNNASWSRNVKRVQSCTSYSWGVTMWKGRQTWLTPSSVSGEQSPMKLYARGIFLNGVCICSLFREKSLPFLRDILLKFVRIKLLKFYSGYWNAKNITFMGISICQWTSAIRLLSCTAAFYGVLYCPSCTIYEQIN